MMALNRPPPVLAIPLDKIRPHEQSDRKLLTALIKSLEGDGVLRDPVLVTEGDWMLLDGTHRYWALREMGCQSIPVCTFDYSSEEIKVGCWYRCLDFCDLSPSFDGIRSEIVPRETALAAVSERSALLSVVCGRTARLYCSSPFDIHRSYRLLSEFEERLRKEGKVLSFSTEEDSVGRLLAGEIGAIVAPPPILKAEARAAASSGDLFPIKSTRHVIPYRPIGIDLPLEWLYLDPDSANRKINEKLRNAKFGIAKKGSVLRGRRYEEEVYIYDFTKP